MNTLKEFKALPQWVNWKYETVSDRQTKIPKNPKTGGNAQTNNKSTWASYELAQKVSNNYDGIGFMFDNGVCGIDLDNKDNDSQFEEQAHAIIQLMDTYTEFSPSGTGYHLIFKCDLARIPTVETNKGIKLNPNYYQKNPGNGVECYFSRLTNRFFTFTGKAINDKAIEDRTDEILVFLERYMKKKALNIPPVKEIQQITPKETQQPNILTVIRRAKNAPKFESLFDKGDISAYNNDDSSADLALCNILAFYCRGDFNEIDTLFRQSALYRSKWERSDYRTDTINKAIARCNGEFYTSKRQAKVKESTDVEGQTEYITIENLTQYLKEKEIELKYNVISRTMNIEGLSSKYSQEHAPDILPIILYNKLKFIYDKCPKGDIQDALSVVSSTNKYNPVLDMLNSDKWDGKDRLPELFNILTIKEDDHLSKTLIYKWLWQCLSMARNELKGAYGADGLLVLQGKQGIGKTSFVRKIAVKQDLCYVGKSLNFQDKDTLRRCASNWLVELGEIETTFKSDKEKLKAFITDETDLYRLPYGRTDIHLARRTSLIGTCNSSEYLIDETGNRRFWTVPVDYIDLEALTKLDALQLWLQVDSETTHSRQGFRLTKDEQAELAKRNTCHEKALKGELEVRDIIEMAKRRTRNLVFKEVTVTEFKMAHDSLKSYSAQQVGRALTKIGIEASKMGRVSGEPKKLRMLPVWSGGNYDN